MQKLIKIDSTFENHTVTSANGLLQNGWKVIQMCPLAEPVASCGEYRHVEKGIFGALLLLEKED